MYAETHRTYSYQPNINREMLMRGYYPEAVNIKCMSHTLDNCGADYTVAGIKHNCIEGSAAKVIYNQINGLFSSPGESIKLSWKSFSGSAMPSVSQTLWWSREEFWAYILPFFKFEGDTVNGLWFEDWIQDRVQSLRLVKKICRIASVKARENVCSRCKRIRH